MRPIDSETTIVSVDDQKSFLHSFQLAAKMLRIKNYSLYQGSNELLRDIPPVPSNIEIFLIDWNMPGSELVGVDLIRKVKSMMPDVPVYILSTSLDDDEIKSAEMAGANGWIHKANMIGNLKKFNVEYQDKVEVFTVWR